MDMPISKETFSSIADAKSRDEILYDIQAGNRHILCETKKSVEDIKAILRKRKHVDKAFSFAGGVGGGILAIMGKWFFFRG
ncbi:hypothetical protein ES708_00743 [subsurface metagenome]